MNILQAYFYLGYLKQDERKIIQAIKTNKFMFNKDVERKISNYIKSKISFQNAVTFFSLVDTFKVQNLEKVVLSYME